MRWFFKMEGTGRQAFVSDAPWPGHNAKTCPRSARLSISSSPRQCASDPAPQPRRLRRAAWAGAACLWALLAGCATEGKVFAPQEDFGSGTNYSRLFGATPAQTCEAARRALLSQGYIVGTAKAELVEGQKNFQPTADSHLQMTIRVVCVSDSADGKISLGFVTAVQDSYALKKANSSASLGVGGVGSVSLPFMSGGGESLVKVGSETIASGSFYESFFDLVKRYLAMDEQLVAD